MGVLRGPGTPTSDSIGALAPANSFILRAEAVRYYSDLFLRRASSRPFAQGGIVSSMPDDAFTGGGGGRIDLKQVLVDARTSDMKRLLSTSENRRLLLDFLTDERTEIRRIVGR